MNQHHLLRLRTTDLEVTLDEPDPQNGSWWFETVINGFDLGTAEAAIKIATSLMRDGDDERIDRYGNRVLTFTVLVKARNSDLLARGGRELALATGRRAILSWTPPDGYGATTDFIVVTSTLKPIFDGGNEMQSGGIKTRRFTLELRCKPWGLAQSPVTQVLDPVAAAPTVLDACSAATLSRWSASWPGYYGDEANTASVATATLSGEDHLHVTWRLDPRESGLQAVAGSLDWSLTGPSTALVGLAVRNPASGIPYTGIRLVDQDSGASLGSAKYTEVVGSDTRYWFEIPGPRKLRFVFTFPGPDTWSVDVNTLLAADAPGVGGVMSVATEGARRAEGSLVCQRPTAMTWLVMHTDPQLATDPLAPGSGGAFFPRLPTSWQNAIDGTYEVYAAQTFAAADEVKVTFTDAAGRTASTLAQYIDTRIAGYAWQPLGAVRLGGFRNGRIGPQTVQVTKNGTVMGTAPELMIFRKDPACSLRILSGINAKKIEALAPTLDAPAGGLWADDVAVPDTQIVAYDVALPVEVPAQAVFVRAADSDTAPVRTTLSYLPAFDPYVVKGAGQ